MTSYVRIYQTDDGAKAAAARLTRAGFTNNQVLLAREAQGQEGDVVRVAVADGILPARQERICVHSLEEGLSLVTAEAGFGRGKELLHIMEKEGTVKADTQRRYAPDDPAPLSELLGIPTLAEFSSSTDLIRSDWTFSSKIGMPLLSKNPAPLSSMFRMKVLSTPKKDWRSSFGLPLLSNNPAPLSSLFGLRTVSKEKRDWRTSFGIPLLMNNPAPLSNLLGLKTVIKD